LGGLGKGDKIIFKKHGRIFYVDGVSERKLSKKKVTYLAKLQSGVLERLENLDKSIFYF